MRILHVPVELAGQATALARGQRALGHRARTVFPPHPFGYGPADRPLSSDVRRARLQKLALLAGLPLTTDVLHCHFGGSLLPDRLRQLDVAAVRRLGVRVAVQFWGSEARLPEVEVARNPDYVNAYAEDEARNRSRLARWADLTRGHVLFVDHSFDAFLAPYFPHIHVTGHAVDVEALQPCIPDPERRRPLLVHAPSSLAFKGTDAVRAAVEELRRRKVAFEYRELSGVSHAESLEVYRTADVVVDQLRAGAHGVLAAEVMALGKPVVCNVLPELRPTYPEGFPVLPATPRTVTDVLEQWLTDGPGRAARGRQSRAYAESHLDQRKVASRVLAAYERMA